MEQRSTPMTGNFVLFLVLSFAILFGYMALEQRLNPRPARKPVRQEADAAAGREAGKEKPKDGAPQQQPERAAGEPREEPAGPPVPADEPPDEKPEVAAKPKVPRKWVTLGSGDPNDPYRMLVTLDSKGGAVVRIELNSPRYCDLEDRSGYLGHLVIDETEIDKPSRRKGALVQVVGPGTPAAKAGLRPGDLIVAVGKEKITSVAELRSALRKTKPKRCVALTVLRGQKKLTLTATLRQRPLEVIRPEKNDPLSFLLTLHQLDGRELSPGEQTVDVGKELPGLDLWTGNWEVVAADPSQAVFRRLLPKSGLEITKSYRLAKASDKPSKGKIGEAYHLVFDVKIRNTGEKAHQVAYQLDGPNGLPAEGAWYAYKVGRAWGAVGLRDVVVSFNRATPSLIGCPKIANAKVDKPWQEAADRSLTYIGVDAQYFSCVLLPQKEEAKEIWFAESHPLLVGKPNKELLKTTNTSCRLISTERELLPGGEPLAHRFVVFAGPKKPDLLAQYELKELVYYGWFSWFAVPMAKILHGFYAVVRNYGLAILMLTVLVRGCMFPLSRKQALGARKMQELQPEIKRIQEKHKKDKEGALKAQQELFRKHNYNPLSGCLVLFVQLPIFVALYRSLSVDVELRQAPLISQGIRWCSNLAAPDMLIDWGGFMPEFVVHWCPYFNLLPVLTVILFVVQQKMFMPPAADEQQAMQQKIMSYMMIFIGFLFFKVASGLCVYFIASSLWGLAERRFLPKASPAKPADKPRSRAEAKAQAKPQPKPTPQRTASDGDGAAAGKRKKKSRGRR